MKHKGRSVTSMESRRMSRALAVPRSSVLPPADAGLTVPAVIAAAGRKAARRFVEFFTANIRNPNTRAAYARAVAAFCAWCDERGYSFLRVTPVVIAAYVEQLLADGLARPTVKQHLAAIRMLFDYIHPK